MKKIMFNDKYGLTKAVLRGQKTMTRRIVPEGTMRMAQMEINTVGGELTERIKEHSFYCFLDEVAVAQSYRSIHQEMVDGDYLADRYDAYRCVGFIHSDTPGWTNKMFVRADLMPYRIRITDIKVERLQNISEEDCLKEGIICYTCNTYVYQGVCYSFNGDKCKMGTFKTAKEAFAALIDKVSGKGTWEKNPLVFAYSFKLIKLL